MSSSGGKPRSKRTAQASAPSSKSNAHACSKVVHVLMHALFPLLEHGPLLPAEATEDDNVGKELLLNLQRESVSTPRPASVAESAPAPPALALRDASGLGLHDSPALALRDTSGLGLHEPHALALRDTSGLGLHEPLLT